MAREIFATARRDEILAAVGGFCASRLESGARRFLFFKTGRQAAVFGLELDDGRRVMVKAYRPRVGAPQLRVVHDVQSHLHRQGFPCPRPLLTAPLAHGHALVEEIVEAGAPADPHRPEVRRAMAELLARQVRLAGDHPPGPLGELSTIFDGEALWPDPSDKPLHRLRRPPPSPEWIDALARAAKPAPVPAAARVVAHCDWSAKNIRFEGASVAVVYDWDSLRLESEERLVGRTSAKFTSHPQARSAPTPAEAAAFVDEYEAARAQPFTRAERDLIAAARLYAVAYKARGEYQREGGADGPWQRALRTHGRRYLEA